ncbi:putative multi-domain containing protein, partial [Aduncisulcus paluster]
MEHLKREIEILTASLGPLEKIIIKYKTTMDTLKALSTMPEGKEMLLPLTSAIYVNGKLLSNKKVMIDIGCGFIIERTPEEGIALLERKKAVLQKRIKERKAKIVEKQKTYAAAQDAAYEEARRQKAPKKEKKGRKKKSQEWDDDDLPSEDFEDNNNEAIEIIGDDDYVPIQRSRPSRRAVSEVHYVLSESEGEEEEEGDYGDVEDDSGDAWQDDGDEHSEDAGWKAKKKRKVTNKVAVEVPVVST